MKKIKCEVYTRVVGYFRPVENWNEGKAAEFEQRKEFAYYKGQPITIEPMSGIVGQVVGTNERTVSKMKYEEKDSLIDDVIDGEKIVFVKAAACSVCKEILDGLDGAGFLRENIAVVDQREEGEFVRELLKALHFKVPAGAALPLVISDEKCITGDQDNFIVELRQMITKESEK